MKKGIKKTIDIPAADGSGSFVKSDPKNFVFFSVRDDFRIEFISPENLHKVSEILGWDIQPGIYLPDLCSGQAKDFFREQLRLGFLNQCFSFRILVCGQKGKSTECEVLLTPSQMEAGKTTQLFLTLQIKEISKAVEQNFLKAEEKQFEKLISEGVEMIAIFTPEGEFLSTNHTHQSILGYDPHELLGVNVFKLIHPEDLPGIYSAFESGLYPKEVITQPYRIRRKDGDYLWLKSIGTNLPDDPEIKGIVVNSIQVSEPINTQQELRLNNDRYDYVNPVTKDSLYDWDKPYLGKSHETLFGSNLTPDAAEVKNRENPIHPKDQKRELLAQVIQVFGEERRFNFALDRSLEKLVKFRELDAGEIWLVNSDKTKLNLVSRYALSDAGSRFFSKVDKKASFRKGEGLPGQIWERNEILSVDDLTESAEFTRRQTMLATGMNGDFGFPLHFSGQVVGVAVFTTQNMGGFVRSQLNVFNSISQVLGAEIFRKKMEDELSQIFDTAQDIICILGFDGKFKKINRAASYLLGYSEEELLSGSFMDFVHPEDWIETENVLDHLCQGQKFMHFFNRLITKEGDVVWLDWNSSVIIDEELVYSVAKDITEERELQRLLDSANKMARIGFWEVDVATGMQFWNPVTKEIHEVDDTYVADVAQGIGFYVPEARPIITEYFNRCLETGESYDLELQIISAKGNKIWIRTQGQAEFVGGVCRRVYGSIQDISDLKNTQIHLKEALYEKDQILESIGDGFFSLDKNWIVRNWNHSAEKLLQKPKDQAIGRNIRQILSKDIAAKSIRNYKKAIDNNSPLVYEEFFADLGIWFEISVFPSPIGISVYFKDISLRKTTEELIRQSNERFEKVAEATHEAIWDWELSNNKVYWGSGFKILFGHDPEQAKNSYGYWAAQVHPDDLGSVELQVKHALENTNINDFQIEYRFIRADGTFAYVIDRAVIIRSITGLATRLVGTIQDITDQKLYESSLKSLNEKLETRARELANSNAELEQFAYVASHDLQEPLRMVSSFLTQLELKYGNQLDERAKKYIYYAVDGAKRMRRIILDLLEFSRIGRMEGEKEAIDLEEIIAEVFKLQFDLIQTKNAKITWSDLPIIGGYRTQLLQIFHNLISNALKYSKEGIAPEIHLSCKDMGEAWEFAIHDEGIGISEENFDKIFIIFQRLHASGQFTGSGIGLAIVKKIVENYGGRIWVDSAPGKGTTFRFTLKK